MLYRLKESGYQAHLVGGGVRDLLLGGEPKDFDVATDAEPEQIREIFRNSRIIGRRFRLVHVRFGREIIEVATFRAAHQAEPNEDTHSSEGMILRDNVYGSIEEDAIRRDFTINALYYNIADFSVVDYAGGVNDLENKVLRLMGDPETRYREDPVRIIRAIRFMAKLDFGIAPDTEEPIRRLASLLDDVPAARLFEEILKLFHGGHALKTFRLLRQFDIFDHLFPATSEYLHDESFIALIEQGLSNTDARVSVGKPVTPAFLYAVFLWAPVRAWADDLIAEGHSPYSATQMAAGYVLEQQVRHIAIPKRFSTQMREIWSLQTRFPGTKGKRPHRLASHPRFRAAYDFLLLRAHAGEVKQQLADWWTEFQDPSDAPKPVSEEPRPQRSRRRRQRRRPKKSAEPNES